MQRKLELSLASSCLNKAHDEEVLFVMMARDAAAPDAIRAWAQRRVDLGLNKADDAEIVEAIGAADLMDEQRPELRMMLDKTLSARDQAALARSLTAGNTPAGG